MSVPSTVFLIEKYIGRKTYLKRVDKLGIEDLSQTCGNFFATRVLGHRVELRTHNHFSVTIQSYVSTIKNAK